MRLISTNFTLHINLPPARATQLADAYDDARRIPCVVQDDEGNVIYDSATERNSVAFVNGNKVSL